VALASGSCVLSEKAHNQTVVALGDQDHAFLQASIRLGMSRVGRTAPNPSVGALIVRFDEAGARVVGRGVTADGGRPHGEILALDQAGEEALGATCYVSLEPCAHHGRTPPCVDALLRAGIARVVIAMRDPDPRVSGKGAALMRETGVLVYENMAPREARHANLGHVTRIQNGRPAITLKLAVSKDGMIGRYGEGMVSITGALSRRAVHAMRAKADMLMVGIGTILADDPDLTCRLPGMRDWSPPRVILDTHARTPLDAKVFAAINDVPVKIFVGHAAPPERVLALEEKGAEVVRTDDKEGRLSLQLIMNHLAELGCTHLMVEGGALLAQSLLDEGFIDRAAIFEGTMEIGARGIPALSRGAALEPVLRAHALSKIERLSYGDDRLSVWERA